MSKYDWSKVPDRIMWMAKDQNNVVCGYVNKPIIVEDFWTDRITPYYFESTFHLPNVDWKDSLEERPK